MSRSEATAKDPECATSGPAMKKKKFSKMQFLEESTMTFHNICYTIELKTGYFGFRKKTRMDVLRGVSGIMKPGINAILGPTGCGKSSLLDILATRKDPHGLSGDILINGAPHPPHFKCISGYVVQEDLVMGTLTVRENLEFSAALRLPRSMSLAEKQERVNQVIVELDLSKVADSKIGTHFIRGVSGGEKKRTSIGLELLTNPTILFLDEPTTGLDASTANAVLLLLKRMSLQGKTIIFSIHQPRYSIFKLFDSLTLLAAGRLLYHGPANKAMSYFSSLGYMCEPYNNPADFFLDVINGDSTAVAASKIGIDMIDIEELVSREQNTIAETLALQYSRCNDYKRLAAELEKLSLENKRRETIYEICITVVMGAVVGAIFSGVKDNSSGIQNRVGALFFLTTSQCLNSITTVELFITEKRLFIHEYISGYYRLSAYFFSKIVADMIPMRTIPGILLTSINYFLIGFKPKVEAFFVMMITIILVAYTASSMALAIATGQDVTSVANLLINLCFVFMIVFSGLLVNVTTIPPWLLWLKYFSIPRYGMDALQINEFTGLNFCENLTTVLNVTCVVVSPFTVCDGEEYLEAQGISLTAWGMWQNYVALVSLTLIFLSTAYLKLRLIKKYT